MGGAAAAAAGGQRVVPVAWALRGAAAGSASGRLRKLSSAPGEATDGGIGPPGWRQNI